MFGKLNLSTYSSLLTNRRLTLVASHGKCGYSDYREAQIRIVNGKFWYIVTDGYRYLTIGRTLGSNLKSALNIIEGELCS
jgi:hypothetical protein